MKKTVKNILKTTLAVLCAVAMVLMCAEYQDGSIGLWNFIWLAVFAGSGWALDKVATNTK